MNCLECGAALGPSNYCPSCGTNVRMLKKIYATSNSLYNNGLECARNRDMMKAIDYLQRSLQFNKHNIDARNLLGLCYYEVGEIVDAMVEWVISNNFQPEDNLATGYLAKLQQNKGRMESACQGIHKYNAALRSAQKGDIDIAIIQLKKVCLTNPQYLKAQQLLALLYIKTYRYDLAAKYVRSAERIDHHNATTELYKKVCTSRKRHTDKKAKELDPPAAKTKNSVTYKSGNETIIRPRRIGENPAISTFITLVVGIVIGVCAVSFLVVPNIRQNANSTARSEVVAVNESMATQEASVQGLEQQILDMEQTVSDAEAQVQAAEEKNTSYQQLLVAYRSFANANYSGASEALANVNTEYLDSEGMAIYNEIEGDVKNYNIKSTYNAALNLYSNGDYASAAEKLLAVCTEDEGYSNNQAAFYLANAYYMLGKYSDSREWFMKVYNNSPNSTLGRQSKTYADGLSGYTGSSTSTPESEPGTEDETEE